MSKKRLWIISAAMSISVIGVILIQVYWITNAYTTTRERFFREVEAKLDDVIEKHEVLLTFELIEDFDQRGFMGVSSLVQESNFKANIDSNAVVFKKFSVDIEEVSFEPNTEKLVRMQGGDSKHILPDTTVITSTSEAYRGIELKQTDSNIVDLSTLRSDSEGRLFRLLRSFLTTTPSINPNRFERQLDSLLIIEIDELNPKLNFQYEIIDQPADTISKFINLGKGGYSSANSVKKKLFPSSTAPHNLHLLVNIVDPVKVVMSRMRLILTSSVIFLLIIVYSFYYTINSLIRQGKLSQMKSDFINNMTHELKTPITTISLATEALLDRNIEMSPDKVHNMSKLISRENERLKSQVERVLQMERLDRNKIKLDTEPIHLNALLEDILGNVSIQVESKNGNITWSLKADHDLVAIDELHVSNIIYNLIDNAIKYSKERLEIFVHSYSHNNSIYIDVEDKGIGITREMQDRVFERFYRVPTGNLHDVKGFGLGLSYVKEMMHLHGGDVKVISRVGKGSTFTLIFPILNNNDNDKH